MNAAARAALADVISQLPPELRDDFDPGSDVGRDELIAALAREGAADAMACLQADAVEQDA